MPIDDGGPAFGHGDHTHGGAPGMSLRDWFAGQALAGLISPEYANAEIAAETAYMVADAMLAARTNGDTR